MDWSTPGIGRMLSSSPAVNFGRARCQRSGTQANDNRAAPATPERPLAIGFAAAIALTRLLTSVLFEVKPTEPRIFVAVAVTLIAVALLAALIPSLRAVRIQPATALREE